jgi:WD40 repeat protein
MSNRWLTSTVDIMLLLLGALLGIATNYLTSSSGPVPLPFRWLRSWSVPLVFIVLALLVLGRLLQHRMDRASVPKRPTWNSARPPYPGLESFTEEDAAVFFGRTQEISELAARFDYNLSSYMHRFITIIGPSGSGKSSLMNAGLIPSLKRKRGRWQIVGPFVPGSDAVLALARSLASSSEHSIESVIDSIRNVGLAAAIDGLRVKQVGSVARVVLVVDQLEELITMQDATNRNDFLRLIQEGLKAESRIWVVATLRSDFLTDFLAEPMAALFRSPFVVAPLDRHVLVSVIEGPAEQAGFHFDHDVVLRIVDEAGGGDALPLLAYTLHELVVRAGTRRTISMADYDAVGGVTGALTLQADRIAEQLASGGDLSSILDTLLKFVNVEGGTPTRRRVHRDELTDDQLAVVDAFVSGRLLTVGMISDQTVIEVAHDALIRHWAPLRQAAEALSAQLATRYQLERWAMDWEDSGRSDIYLLSGDRLHTAEQWTRDLAGSTQDPTSPIASSLGRLIHEFLDASKRADLASLQQLSESLAQRALVEVDLDPELAVLLALAAIEECAPTNAAYRSLMTGLAACRLRLQLVGHTDWVRGVAWSPDGQRIATASSDHTIRVWGADTGLELAILNGHEAEVQSVCWSPDGRKLASGSRDRTVRIWQADAYSELAVLRGHEAEVQSVCWSPDGTRLLSASSDCTVHVWDAVEGTAASRWRAHEKEVRDVAWSPDGRLLATASRDGIAAIWDAESLALVRKLEGHIGWLSSVSWAADSRRIATGSRDMTARIWDSATGEVLAIMRGHVDDVRCVRWSSDGSRLGTASYDRTVRVWDAESAGELSVLRSTKSWVLSLAWSPDSKRIVSGSQDPIGRIWDTEQGDQLVVLGGHEGEVKSLAWSPDSQLIATGSRDSSTRLWTAGTGTLHRVLKGHDSDVRGLAWSPDGDRLATVSYDTTLRIWNVRTGEMLHVFKGHNRWIFGVAWCSDNIRLATSSQDQTVRIWDSHSGRELAILFGHDDDVRCVAWSPDGKRIATGSRDRTVRLWNTERGSQLDVLSGHLGEVNGVAWAPDSRVLASASQDGTVRFWQASTGEEVACLGGHEGAVRAVAFSPAGDRVITGSQDRTARIWDVRSQAELFILHGHLDWVEAVAWSPDSRLIATGSRDRTARIWDAALDLPSLLAKTRQRLSRSLSEDERRAYLLPERHDGSSSLADLA